MKFDRTITFLISTICFLTISVSLIGLVVQAADIDALFDELPSTSNRNVENELKCMRLLLGEEPSELALPISNAGQLPKSRQDGEYVAADRPAVVPAITAVRVRDIKLVDQSGIKAIITSEDLPFLTFVSDSVTEVTLVNTDGQRTDITLKGLFFPRPGMSKKLATEMARRDMPIGLLRYVTGHPEIPPILLEDVESLSIYLPNGDQLIIPGSQVQTKNIQFDPNTIQQLKLKSLDGYELLYDLFPVFPGK